MQNRYLTIYLTISGMTMLLVGTFIALTPYDYINTLIPNQIQSSSNNIISNLVISVDMLSDLRGMGGMLLFFGVFTVVSAFKSQLRSSALISSTLVFSAYSAMRSFSFLVDGIPSLTILIAYGIEMSIVFWGIALLSKHKESSEEQNNFICNQSNRHINLTRS